MEPGSLGDVKGVGGGTKQGQGRKIEAGDDDTVIVLAKQDTPERYNREALCRRQSPARLG
ncbi:MAG: hypothetical protein L0H73_04215 [Nitrococcus sp.]|nr:hypothetical protein [Nitrococcus sp.]